MCITLFVPLWAARHGSCQFEENLFVPSVVPPSRPLSALLLCSALVSSSGTVLTGLTGRCHAALLHVFTRCLAKADVITPQSPRIRIFFINTLTLTPTAAVAVALTLAVTPAGGSYPAAAEERTELAARGEAAAGLHKSEAGQPAWRWTALAGAVPPAGGVLLLHRGEDGGGLGLPRQPKVKETIQMDKKKTNRVNRQI